MSLIAIFIFKIFCIHSFDWWTICFHSDGLGRADSDWDAWTQRGNWDGDFPEIVLVFSITGPDPFKTKLDGLG